MKVFVTGACGQVGSHVTELLLERGDDATHLQGDLREHDDRADLHHGQHGGRHRDHAEEGLAPVRHTPSPEGLAAGPPRACS